MPESFGAYYEPFIGGGALFFDTCSSISVEARVNRIFLGDMNSHLINTYEVVRDDLGALVPLLQQYKEQHCEDFYYEIRDHIFDGDDVTRAANFIYLNKTGFNGLYRVNKSGGYNVPFGRHKNPGIFDLDVLQACHAALQGVHLAVTDYKVTVESADRGDFVYFDPPYVPAGANSDFVSYTSDGFGDLDQAQLRDTVLALKSRGVRVLLSNSDTEEVRRLYRYKDYGFEMERVEATRSINSDATKRGAVGELLIW